MRSNVKAIAKTAALAKGYWTLGNWNGDLSVEVEMLSKAKVVSGPADLFPVGVQAILVNKNAAPAFNKFMETTFHDKVPGHGTRLRIADIGAKHDQLIYDELSRGIYVFRETAATTYTVTYEKGDDAATGTAPTQAAVKADAEFVLAENTFTLTGKTFVGWSDGNVLYPAGYNYVAPANNMTLTAIWT